jgi:transposase
LKQRVHAVLLTHGKPCRVSDLFGVRGRQLLVRFGLPEPWQATIEASLRLIDELDREMSQCERELRQLGADHRYVPLLCTMPGIGWVLAYTIAAKVAIWSKSPALPSLRRSKKLTREQLIAEGRSAAVEMAHEFFFRFGWEPAVEQLIDHQREPRELRS